MHFSAQTPSYLAGEFLDNYGCGATTRLLADQEAVARNRALEVILLMISKMQSKITAIIYSGQLENSAKFWLSEITKIQISIKK